MQPDLADELVKTGRSALRWLAKAIADDAFRNCVNPLAAKSDFESFEAALAKIKP